MKRLHSALRLLVLPLGLIAGSCTSEPEDDGGPAVGSKKAHGSFQVTLKEPTSISQGYTAILGKLFDGPSPSALGWKEVSASGGCRLLTPDLPFCETSCGSKAMCVEDGKCQAFPNSVTAGRVNVDGIKTKSGSSAFSMDPLLNSYQPPAGTQLEFPPFAEGEQVTFSAAGDTAVGAFTLTASGISPLALLNDTIVLADGQPISLRWTAPTNPSNSTVSVLVDISHHGGTKGKIECEVPDNGSLDIPAAMVDALKALGVAGFPKLEASRKSTATQEGGNVKLVLESMVVKDLSIPGFISCSGNEDCPDDQTCNKALLCEPARKAHGNFQVKLVAPTPITQGYTAVLGKLYDGPTPSALYWKEISASGDCKLLTPDAPFCETPCGSKALCVEDGKCQDFPNSVTAGRVNVDGIKTKSGSSAFSMDPLLNSYQPPAGTQLEFPPFSEGEQVAFIVAGDTAVTPFTLTASGISPLALLNDTIVLADGQPISLRWTAPTNPSNSTVSVLVDISHHGGTKGKIECEASDNGSLDIPAAMVDALKALGVAGFPKLEVSRKAVATQEGGNVSLVLESMVVKDLSIPGLISCSGNEDCPDGQTCQPDLQCK